MHDSNEIKLYAHISNEEVYRTSHAKNIPTVDSMLKKLDKGTYKVDRHSFLSDVFEVSAIAISNQFDSSKFNEREEKYKKIMKKYDKSTQELICEIFADIYILLSSQIFHNVGFYDYLGELYMRSETSNKQAGQFFTPYSVSKMCARLTINDDKSKFNIENAKKTDRILTFNEPSCGSGGMIIASVDCLYREHHFNYCTNLLVECSDIDLRCVHMCYLQLALSGVPAIVKHQDTLTQETWDVWRTPACLMQYVRFRKIIKEG